MVVKQRYFRSSPFILCIVPQPGISVRADKTEFYVVNTSFRYERYGTLSTLQPPSLSCDSHSYNKRGSGDRIIVVRPVRLVYRKYYCLILGDQVTEFNHHLVCRTCHHRFLSDITFKLITTRSHFRRGTR
jgi:hypothetical protein